MGHTVIDTKNYLLFYPSIGIQFQFFQLLVSVFLSVSRFPLTHSLKKETSVKGSTQALHNHACINAFVRNNSHNVILSIETHMTAVNSHKRTEEIFDYQLYADYGIHPS
jgi:hypothetical protein